MVIIGHCHWFKYIYMLIFIWIGLYQMFSIHLIQIHLHVNLYLLPVNYLILLILIQIHLHVNLYPVLLFSFFNVSLSFKYIYMLIFISWNVYFMEGIKLIQIHLHVNLYLVGVLCVDAITAFKYIYMLIFIMVNEN